MGLAYGAKVTPHMYVIDPSGKVAYNGAIDDKRSTDVADVKTAKNFVVAALDEMKAGKPVSNASNSPVRLHHQVQVSPGAGRQGPARTALPEVRPG